MDPLPSDPTVLMPSESCASVPDPAIATFADSALGTVIRDQFSLDAEAPLYCSTLRSVRQLNASSAGVVDLTGMQNLTGISGLNLIDNAISDLGPLATLSGLTHLELGWNQIVDVGPLEGLSSLEHLGLRENAISDLSPLAALANLEVLTLRANLIGDVSPLAGLPALTVLELLDNQIADVAPLGGMTGLVSLDVSRNPLADLEPLGGLTSLFELSFYGTDVTEIDAISNFQSLEALNGNGTDIIDIDALQTLQMLRTVRLQFTHELGRLQPLIDNPGFTSGDTVNVLGSGVWCGDVAALKADGVEITTSCLEPQELCDFLAAAYATFEDPGLDAAVRTALGIGPYDNIECPDLANPLPSLDASGAGIESLVGAQNLVGLTDLDLSDNPGLADIQPLLDNPELGVGDSVDLNGTGVACADVTALRAHGVTVASTCP